MAGTDLYHEGTLGALVAAYLIHTESYYQTREAKNQAATLGRLLRTRADVEIDEFRAKAIKAWRDELIVEGLSRLYINRCVKHLRMCYRWGVEEELIGPELLQVISAVRPLKCGRTAAPETEPVEPVDPTIYFATIPHLSRQIRAILELQRLTGARTGEIRVMRTCDITSKSDDLWIYSPPKHKTEHHGKTRIIPLDRPCIDIVMEHWLGLTPEAPVFRSPRTGQIYAEGSIGNAVRVACRRHGIELWHPHQLRHRYLEMVDEATNGDIEICRAVAGHSDTKTTMNYIKADERKAIDAMRRVREGGAS